MDLSVVDLSPVPEDGTAVEAYEQTVDAAQHAERLGFERFWVAEHHGMTERIAGTSPEVLLGHLAAETESIRLGSGAVLLNHYSPFKVAEQFGVLDGLAPGRVDAGLGRANGSPAVDRALGTSRRVKNPDEDHRQKITAVVNHLYDDFHEAHQYADIQIPSSDAEEPVPWVLGSSTASAKIAGQLGLRFCFAAFIRPELAVSAFRAYRDVFEPSSLAGGIDESDGESLSSANQGSKIPGGVDDPEGMVALNAVAAETDEAAARLRAVAEATFERMQRGEIGATPSVEEAIEELGGVPEPTPATLDGDEWPRAISGSPETVSGLLEQLADRVGVDEMMIQHVVPEHDAALRSHELIAEGVGIA